MGRENFDGLDLFGNPVPKVRDRAGRPQKEWTEENSNKINLLFATGSTPKEAAAAIDMSMPVFRREYFSEIREWKVAKLKLRASQLLRLYQESSAGSVAAIKELFKQMDKGALVRLADDVANRQRASKPQPAGKKEQQTAAAHGYRGKFAAPEGPSRVN